jgi:pimeloyl-ACP methyl ester carboxylesterase
VLGTEVADEVGIRAIHTAGESLEDRFIEVDGMRMRYVHAGTGRPLLLIHGLVGSAANWAENIAALARHSSVYAVDLVNMGRSERVGGLDASLAATADRVDALMEALGLAEADIAGHSHGGAVALMLAARHSDRVRSLILFAPINPFSNLEDSLIRLYRSAPGRRLAAMAPYLPRWVQRIALGRMYGDPARIGEETLEGYVEGLRVPGTVEHVLAIVRGWHADMAALAKAIPRAARIPTLLVWGDRDRAVSVASGERLHREMAASELLVLRGGGHVVFAELPAECNRAMSAWLSRGHEPAWLASVPRAQPQRVVSHGVAIPTCQRQGA